MSDAKRTVQMYLIQPGKADSNGEFTFELEPRINAGRSVTFALMPSDAETLRKALDEYFKVQR